MTIIEEDDVVLQSIDTLNFTEENLNTEILIASNDQLRNLNSLGEKELNQCYL